MNLQLEKCYTCDEQIEEGKFYLAYSVQIGTDKQMHVVGIKRVLEELADYLMQVNIHLSASQVLLLRPDVMKVFWEEKYPGEKLILWYLKECYICYECFESWKQLIPLI